MLTKIIAAALLLVTCGTYAAEWSDPAEVHRGREGVVVSYRAKLTGDLLQVEVTHAEGWHTYSMDNVVRAQKKTGKDKPETELPTRIAVTGGLVVTDGWHQSKPIELSQEDIQWYTWGFEDKAVFAARVKRGPGATAKVTINAQSCNATSCSMVDGLEISIELPDALGDDRSPFPENLVPLLADPSLTSTN